MSIAPPFVRYTMISVDQCEKTITYQKGTNEAITFSESEWTPHYPDEHTESVTLEISLANGVSTEIEISGDAHRDIEGYGHLDEFIRALLNGESVNATLIRLIDINADA